MSSTTFELDAEYNMTGEGSLGSTLLAPEQESLASCFRRTVESFRKVEEMYLRAVSNDGKIIGGERVTVLDEIDNFLNFLVLLYGLLFVKKGEEYHISIKDDLKDIYVNFTVRGGRWTSDGRLTEDIVRPAGSFRAIFTDRLAPEMSRFLSDYKTVFADGKLEEAESLRLKNDLRRIMYLCLYLRFQVQLCAVSG